MDVEFNFIDEVSDVYVGTEFELPTFNATDYGEPIAASDITVRIRMGANLVDEFTAETTKFTHNVASILTVQYIYKDVVIGSCDINVGFDGNLIDDPNWSSGVHNTVRQYNARVNITLMTTSKLENIFCIPLRNYSTNVDWYGGLSFRPGKSDNFICYPMDPQGSIGGIGWTGAPSLREMFGESVLNGEYHVFSYQVVDVLDENYELTAIRIYIWADGEPVKISGLDYYEVPSTYQYFRMDEIMTPAAITRQASAGVRYSAITFGENNMDMTGMVTMESEKTFGAGDDYEIPITGLTDE